MAIKLNTDGLIPDDNEGRNKKQIGLSRHKTKRKAVALNFSNAHKPLATSLAYWQKHKLATPLFWYLFDSLAKQKKPEEDTEVLAVEDVLVHGSPIDFGKKLLEELRNQK